MCEFCPDCYSEDIITVEVADFDSGNDLLECEDCLAIFYRDEIDP